MACPEPGSGRLSTPERTLPAAVSPVSTAGDRFRFLLVASGAFVLCAAYAWRGYFSSDFWEHAAVVRELAARPFAPQHPLLAIQATHAYFSPFHLVVALVVRALNISAISALAAAGLLNVLLLMIAFRRFLVRLIPEGDQAAPYALLFILFLWGKNAWMWSGFLHVGFLGYGAPYPSTLAAAAMFLCLSLLLDALERGRWPAYVGIGVLVAFCVITHPPTALVLFTGLAALFGGRIKERVLAHGTWLFLAMLGGVVLAAAWPYFPVLTLFGAQPAEFHAWSRVFYEDVLGQVWPVIVALPVLLWRLRHNRRDPLVLFFLILSVIYAAGAITGKFGLGRVIAYIAVLVQIALGVAAASWERQLRPRGAWLVPASAIIVSLGLFVYDRPPLPRFLKHEPTPWRDAAVVLVPVRSGDVVLADSRTSYFVPVLTGGRVVAWRHPVYWVPDHLQRQQDQKRFFTQASDEERRAMIARYDVRWILLNRQEVRLGPDEQQRLLGLGCLAAVHDSLVLVDVAATCARGAPRP